MSGTDSLGRDDGNVSGRDRLASVKTIVAHGCEVTVSEFRGVVARELNIHCQPLEQILEAADQARALYNAIDQILGEHGGGFESVVSESVFHRCLASNVSVARVERLRAVETSGTASPDWVVTEVEQPPINQHAWLDVQVHAVLPVDVSVSKSVIKRTLLCECAECVRCHGLLLNFDNQSKFYSGALYGRGETAYDQTHDMFLAAERLLREAGMEFRDVVRTWIYLEEMESDYPQLNKARREFFEKRGIHPPPASTGIGARLVPGNHNLCLSVVAVKGSQSIARTLMTTPTLNEAPHYGADFSRGMRVSELNTDVLYVSGTASLNERGQSVYLDDFDAQVDRMLVNVKALLAAQGATFEHIVSAITYVKNLENAVRLEEKFRSAGYIGFPNPLVVAPVCRPELLCETEVLAVTHAVK